MRNGDIRKYCQVPLLGLRLQNEIDGRGVAPARPWGQGTQQPWKITHWDLWIEERDLAGESKS